MITIRGLRKRFGALEVLRGVDLDVRPGRIAALVGPNASGKTTLIKTVLGLVRPDAGSVTLDGHVLNGDWRYRERIGYMPQLVRFPENLSGQELLSLLDGLRGHPASRDEELLEAFCLGDQMAKPFRALSGGTRQKLNAVIAFRFGADLLILDEPTAGLDPLASRALKEKILRERESGRTVVLTSHNMGELQDLSDDIVLLLEGRVRFRGPLASLKERAGEDDLERALARLMEGEPA